MNFKDSLSASFRCTNLSIKGQLRFYPHFEPQLRFYPHFFDFAFLPLLFAYEASVYPYSCTVRCISNKTIRKITKVPRKDKCTHYPHLFSSKQIWGPSWPSPFSRARGQRPSYGGGGLRQWVVSGFRSRGAANLEFGFIVSMQIGFG